jgi:medium-chain acyl-[acyl-carrier-protein] hydrolase
MGALVAHEIACKFRELEYPQPDCLFVGASRAPQLPWPHQPIRHLPDLEFLDQVNLRYGSVPTQVREDAELRAIFVPALRGDFSIVETYRCVESRQLSCPISAFAGDQDLTVTKESVEAWRSRTTGRFQVRDVRGSHLFLRTAPQQIHDAILQDLEAAWAHSGRRVGMGVHESAV